MKRIIVTFAGGRLGVGFSRALKHSKEPYYLIALDSSKVQLHRAVADEKHLIPRADDEAYIPVVNQIAEETGADLLWVNHEAEIALVSRNADRLKVRTWSPARDSIEFCQDKMASYQRFKQAGVPVPESIFINSEQDLEEAFRSLGYNLWLRAIAGTGGKGSLPVSDTETAKRWIDINRGWGRFMAAQRLTDETVTWESIWDRGRLVAAQGRRRLYWEFSSLTLSGITGVGGAHRWVADPLVDQTALQAIKAIDTEPHGIFGVDMTYDVDGVPMVTEINCGRFMSGGVIFHVTPECNLALVAAQAALGELPAVGTACMNPLPQDVVLLHGMDIEPVLVDIAVMEECARALEVRRESLLTHVGGAG